MCPHPLQEAGAGHRAVTRRHSSGLTRGRFELVEALRRERVHERRMAAVEVLALRRNDLELAHAPLLERLIRESRTCALVDNLAGTVVDSLAESS